MKAYYTKHILKFKRPSGTSRGVLNEKETYFIVLKDSQKWGIGECGILRGLSIDDRPDYEEKLQWICDNIFLSREELFDALRDFPSIKFGLESAHNSFLSASPFKPYPSKFTDGKKAIPINGLVWMGEKAFMKEQIVEKIEAGFSCIKLKIGAIGFDAEMDLLKFVRKEFSETDIELRVDANGSFSVKDALEKLKRLGDFKLHSIEQPIMPGQWDEMAKLCEQTPLPIALDEELIGHKTFDEKTELLDHIIPQYIILKPSLIGGLEESDSWISLAQERNIGWWITSALESNIGLNIISQYSFTKNSNLPQGLGTGGLYTNNIVSPLQVQDGSLFFKNKIKWDFKSLDVTN